MITPVAHVPWHQTRPYAYVALEAALRQNCHVPRNLIHVYGGVIAVGPLEDTSWREALVVAIRLETQPLHRSESSPARERRTPRPQVPGTLRFHLIPLRADRDRQDEE